MKKGCIVLHLLCSLFIQSCISDSIKNLGNGYFYRDEGENIKDILCQKSNGGEIPATVLDYIYNDEYIIAKQKPKYPQEPLYKRKYEYGTNDSLFYWIILKTNDVVLGPLSWQEYLDMRLKYQIPIELSLY